MNCSDETKVKTIYIVLYNISFLGGILTHMNNLSQGFKDLGIETKFIFFNRSGKSSKNSSETDHVNTDFTFSYIQDTNSYNEFLNLMTPQDILLFEVIPHKTKSFDELEWQNAFKSKAQNFVIIHDPSLGQYYSWVKDVCKYINGFIGVQYKTIESFRAIDCKEYEIIYHPFRIDESFLKTKESEKERYALAPHQWKSWKRMEEIVESGTYLREEDFLLITTNTGIIHRYISSEDKTRERWQNIQKIYEENLKYGKYLDLGVLPKEKINQMIRKSKVLIDISYGEFGRKNKFPNINYSLLEGMLAGSNIVISYKASDFPNFPKGNYVIDESRVVESLSENIKKAMNEYDPELIQRNRKFVIDNFDYRNICKKYLRYFDKRIDKKIDLPIEYDLF